MQSKVLAALLLAPGVLSLAGCAMGKPPSAETYTYTENNARMLTNAAANKMALSAASQVCAKSQKRLLPLESGRLSQDTYAVSFRCLTPRDPAVERPGMAQNPVVGNPLELAR